MTILNCVNVPNVPRNVGGAISPRYTGTTTLANPEAKLWLLLNMYVLGKVVLVMSIEESILETLNSCEL